MLEVDHVALRFLRHARPPGVRVEVQPQNSSSYVMFETDAFEVDAAVALRGSGKDARLGWTQIQTVEINRAAYRGLTPGAGRAEVFRDRSPKAMNRLCRDVSLASDVFTCRPGTQRGLGYTPQQPLNIDLGTVALPGTAHVSHADRPYEGWMIRWDNERTRQPNYLAWAKIEMRFVAVLLLRHADGRLQQLKQFNWGVQWEERFEPVMHGGTVATVRRLGGDANNRTVFTPFADGPVADPTIAALIAAPGCQTCGERTYLRNNDPLVHEHAGW